MPEKPVRIPVEKGEIILEGLFSEGKIGRNVVLCHPHPLYGGNMGNNVVLAAQQAFAGFGWGTLRFNFRGAGASGGEPAQGEKDAEDLVAVSRYLEEKHPGRLDLAAYSYGAWVGLKAVRLGLSPESVALFSPPLDFISFEGLALPDVQTLITLGNQDEFCSVESLKKWLAAQSHEDQVTLDIFPYGDHFYWGAEQELSLKIKAFLERSKHDQ
ncbi:MAG: alpha/beta hydrolase [Syntrophobacteraceae bacterium]